MWSGGIDFFQGTLMTFFFRGTLMIFFYSVDFGDTYDYEQRS